MNTRSVQPALVATQRHCRMVNLDSRFYHYSGNRSYRTTKKGAYMCETGGQGFRAARNEKRP